MSVSGLLADDRKPRPVIGRRTIFNLLMLVVASVLLAWLGWTRGRYRSIQFRVRGPSMAPTLAGEHYEAACGRCGRRAVAVDASVEVTLPAEVPCFLCGEPLKIDTETVRHGDMVTVLPLTRRQSIDGGQLVAIDAGDGLPLRVKRVAAVGGQTVDHDAGRLTVDCQRIEDTLFDRDPTLLPQMVVADESRTTAAGLKSRWSASDENDSVWRFDNGIWSSDHNHAMESDWLVYHHVNVHEDGVAAPVMDDYEYNASLMRRLDEVDRLQVTADIDASKVCRIEVAYWMPRGLVLESQTFPPLIDIANGRTQIFGNDEAVAARSLGRDPPVLCTSHGIFSRETAIVFSRRREPTDMCVNDTEAVERRQQYGILRECRTAVAVPRLNERLQNNSFHSSTHSALDLNHETVPATSAAPVTRESPLAIRVVAQKETETNGDHLIHIKNLCVWKSVTYRLRRTDDRSRYPITLGEGEYFVVGDNVPVSIDSRDHGPIRRDNIVGVIKSSE